MPRTRRETLTVISAFASAISSRTRSCTFSVTSWIASPRSEGRGSVIARDRPENLREQEGADERGARQHLGPVGGGPPARPPAPPGGGWAAPAVPPVSAAGRAAGWAVAA